MVQKLFVLNLFLSLISVAYSNDVFEKVVITIPKENFDKTDGIEAYIPICKYNKDFALSFTGDDALTGIYQRAFNYVQGRYVDDKDIFHALTQKPTTGFIPEKRLVHTDGCGNDIPFRLSVNWMSGEPGKTMHSTGNIYTPQMWWTEAVHFTDFYGGILNHGGYLDKINPSEAIAFNFKEIQDSLDLSPYLLGIPGGTTGFPDAADESEYVYFVESSQFQQNGLSIKLDILNADNIYKFRLPRICIDTKEHTWINEYIDNRANSSYWINMFCHNIKNNTEKVNGQLNADTCYNMLNYIYNNYGKGGKDNVWFASDPEIMEYQYSRLKSEITYKENGDNVLVEINFACLPGFYFNELSLIIPNLLSTENIKFSDNIITYSLAENDNKGLLNFSFSEFTKQRAVKYLDILKKDFSSENLEDAKFFINRLRPELKEEYLDRLNNIILSVDYVSNENDHISILGNIISVSDQLKSKVYIYDLAGKVYKVIKPLNVNQTISLEKGIYILNNKKIIIS